MMRRPLGSVKSRPPPPGPSTRSGRSLEPDEADVEALFERCLIVDAGQLVVPWLVSKRVRTPRIAGRLQFDEHLEGTPLTRRLRLGHVDRPRVQVRRIDPASRIDRANLEDVAALEAKPPPGQRTEPRGGPTP